MGRRSTLATLLCVAIGIVAAGCSATSSGSGWERLRLRKPPPAGRNWPLPATQAEKLMASGEEIVRAREQTDAGITGAERITVYFPAIRRAIRLKWKAAPPGDADGWNNAPRKELAAYAIQKWFLLPRDYVVPTAVGRCLSLETYRATVPEAKPTLPGTRCVFGIQSLWLEDVAPPETLYDEAAFARDPLYARHLANFNLLTFLIENRDTRDGNVLASKDASNRRIFSVDNGISFDPLVYNFFLNQWRDIRVPALPRASIEPLRRLTRERVDELAVVAQFRVDANGILRPERPGAPIDPKRGSRFRDGVLQLGLTDDEIAHVWERVQALLREVDTRELALF